MWPDGMGQGMVRQPWELPQSWMRFAGWLGALSALTFLLSLAGIPWLVNRLPPDYFVRHRHGHRHTPWRRLSPSRFLLRLVRHVVGLLLVAAGVVMLVLPGQGLLTLVIGLSLIDFPGKARLVERLAAWPPIFAALNWIRHKGGRPAFIAPEPASGDRKRA